MIFRGFVATFLTQDWRYAGPLTIPLLGTEIIGENNYFYGAA